MTEFKTAFQDYVSRYKLKSARFSRLLKSIIYL